MQSIKYLESVHLAICLPGCLPIYLSICLSIHLSIHSYYYLLYQPLLPVSERRYLA